MGIVKSNAINMVQGKQRTMSRTCSACRKLEPRPVEEVLEAGKLPRYFTTCGCGNRWKINIKRGDL